jgi:TolB-like protein
MQDMDKELSDLAEKLAIPVKEHGKTKVAVIDFVNLEGQPEGELGKYVAEQLTVNLVMSTRGFSVLDRANLRKILAEHKLTSKGLVDPDNAKKLGMFAGVDALILGTIIPKASNSISLTAKIITTDTAEIIGAARAEFKTDETVRQLMTKPAVAETPAEESQSEFTPAIRKPFGDLQAKVESLRVVPGDNYYGYATLTLVISNMSDSKTYGVAMSPNPYTSFSLTNNRGDEFRGTEVSGIDTAFDRGGSFSGSMSDIPPKSSISVSIKSQVRWNGRRGDYRPYRFQTVIVFGEEKQGRHPDLRKCNVVLDIK